MMIITSKKTAYDGERYTVPEWQFDTQTYTVTHTEDGMLSKETTFDSEWVRFHVDYTVKHFPERFQKLVDSGQILDYLNDFDDRIWEAIDNQTEHWIKTNKEYQLAKANNDYYKQAGLANMLRDQAKEAIYPAMVYV